MKAIRLVSVRARFTAVTALVTLSLAVLGGWGHLATRQGIQSVSSLFDQAGQSSTSVGNLRESLASLLRYESAMIAESVSNPTGVERYRRAWNDALANLRKSSQAFVARSEGDTPVAALAAEQKALLDRYEKGIAPIAQNLQDAKIEASAALAYAGEFAETTQALQANSVALLKAQEEAARGVQARLNRDLERASLLRLVLVAGVVLLFVPLMWVTLRSVCGPLDDAVGVARRIASGDLSAPVPVEGRDEPARLMQALGEMQDGLRSLVDAVRQSAHSIRIASQEVALGNHDLSERTEQAAANLQETASSMAQLTGTVALGARTADTAREWAAEAAKVAQRGGGVVSDVMATMEDIQTGSRKIADIISVIDGIAFQTNILALNAAVEAARAGEQGRGFAVVAGEVRGLAHSSAEAAKEIKALIHGSVAKVELGSQRVAEAGSTMAEIVGSVQRVSDLIGEVSAASGKQSGEINQVGRAIDELDQMTQRNAALVEESAAAAESLKEQARMLTDLVAAFHIDRNTAAGSDADGGTTVGASFAASSPPLPEP